MGTKNKDLGMGISVIIPVYNSEQCLSELVSRLGDTLDKMEVQYEIILINDSSTDGSWDKIVSLSKKYSYLNGLSFKKNFSQDNAIMAGLKYSRGEYIVIMDDDLQHAPEDIPVLFDQVNLGYDVCYANFLSKKQKWWKNIGSWFNGRIAEIVLGKPRAIYLSPFKILHREVVNEIIKYDGPHPYIDGLIFGITKKITQIEVAHFKRFLGKGNYNLVKSISVWLRLATNFSVVPLRIATLIGILFSGLSLSLAFFLLIDYLLGNKAPVGWLSLATILLLQGGVQLVLLGVLGEYVGRLALSQNKKPQFVIDKSIGEHHIGDQVNKEID